MRFALRVEYHGGAFRGWQSQPCGGAVQDVLQRALGEIAGSPLSVVCAGRTDAGVHALAQIVHFDTDVVRPVSAWVRGTNSRLPQTVAVRWAQQVEPDFHARFSAVSRSYRYLLYDSPVRPALDAGRVGWFHLPLNLDAMRAGAQHLLGERDFSVFRAAECQARSPVKLLQQAQVVRHGDLVVFEFRANAFLQHMVRNMVGALVYVGNGRQPPEWIGELLLSRDRRRAAPTFAASGLYFAGVEYESRWRLPDNGRIIAPLALPPR